MMITILATIQLERSALDHAATQYSDWAEE